MDTIFALSSGAPPAAIAVVRLSGPAAFEAVRALAGRLPEPRRASLATLRDPADGSLLDRGLILTFPGPNSETGEDLAELHLHGGRAIVRAVERVLVTLPALRLAEPGEFTRRALLNGRIDLSQAEGLGDLLMAETEAQRRMALRNAEGAVRREVDGWAARLLVVAAHAEALLDHADEDDVAAGADSVGALQSEAAAVAAVIETAVARPPVERLRDGLRIVLAGPPNAGKSTLFNALAERDAAIVSPTAGTTRDRIEAPVVREGIALVLTDTAGLGEAGDAIEAIGIGRARDALAEADILLWLGDDPPPRGDAVRVHARCDLPGRGQAPSDSVAVSVRTGEGLDQLWQTITRAAAGLVPAPDTTALNRRQRALAAAAAGALRLASAEPDLLLFAEHLRSALRHFDAITGRAGVEAMLDTLFARFCIGK